MWQRFQYLNSNAKIQDHSFCNQLMVHGTVYLKLENPKVALWTLVVFSGHRHTIQYWNIKSKQYSLLYWIHVIPWFNDLFITPPIYLTTSKFTIQLYYFTIPPPHKLNKTKMSSWLLQNILYLILKVSVTFGYTVYRVL